MYLATAKILLIIVFKYSKLHKTFFATTNRVINLSKSSIKICSNYTLKCLGHYSTTYCIPLIWIKYKRGTISIIFLPTVPQFVQDLVDR